MKKIKLTFTLIILCIISFSCKNEKSFIKDADYKKAIDEKIKSKEYILNKTGLFNVINKGDISKIEKEELEFLYAYMPIANIADYSVDYHLKNIKYANKARSEMPWGKDISDDDFMHFILPPRVNNEALDNFRIEYYEELKNRVKNLSIHDAILEINHWCHEKVTYEPSDSRTSSPMATIKTAKGRCGEESTLLVSALRTVSIPARQVYTPRWAHTDDNHAWVEAKVDNKWHFLGACEPEPVLDLGWFNDPVSRGMLMNTSVFGDYKGIEEIVKKSDSYTEINVTSNYADVDKIITKIEDENNNPVDSAIVEYKLYNYGEYYSVATQTTTKDGLSSLSIGKGDIIIWAHKNGKFGYSKITGGKDKNVTIVLNKKSGEEYNTDIDIVPPKSNPKIPEVTQEQRTENTKRFVKEDSIRHKYEESFINNKTKLESLLNNNNIYKDSEVEDVLLKSKGNYSVIWNFLSKLDNNNKKIGLKLLSLISEKDLRDITIDVLNDNINSYNYSSKETKEEEIDDYVLNPRVSTEQLSPYKGYFKKLIEEKKMGALTPNSTYKDVLKYISDSIKISPKYYYNDNVITTPIGLEKLKMSNLKSIKVFFVSLARSLNIPAYQDPITEDLFIKNGTDRIKIKLFDSKSEVPVKKGKLKANYNESKVLKDPKYETHFTISKFKDDGVFKKLDFYSEDFNGVEVSWSNLLKNGLDLEEGYYMLTTGTRMADGSVLSKSLFFNIKQNETKTINLVMREDSTKIQVIGNFDSESLYQPLDKNELTNILSTTGRGYYVLGLIEAGKEPTNHAIKDICAIKNDIEQWNRKIILLFKSKDEANRFRMSDFKDIPKNVVFGIDKDGSIRKSISEELKLKNNGSLPIFIIGDTFNRVVFKSEGYTIGLGEQLLKTIKGL